MRMTENRKDNVSVIKCQLDGWEIDDDKSRGKTLDNEEDDVSTDLAGIEKGRRTMGTTSSELQPQRKMVEETRNPKKKRQGKGSDMTSVGKDKNRQIKAM